MDKIKQILAEEIEKIRPTEKERALISEKIEEIKEKVNKKLRGKATAIIGGSLAKDTIIKKDKYDADLFVKFFKNPDSNLLEKTLKHLKIKIERLHGSRDYFRSKVSSSIFIEIVPILNITKAEQAENVTDVSQLHVAYIKKKINKNPKLADEIRLAKAFCYALNVYGAESHIRGFSGYCLEVLVCYYGSFLNLLKNATKWNEKVILDPEKYYSGKNEVLTELNESKLISPLIIVDPVQKNRNVSAALSDEKFMIFVNESKKFLKTPGLDSFEKRDLEKEIIDEAKKSKKELVIAEAESNSDKEDVAGAKLIKFQNTLIVKLEKEGYSIKSAIKFSGSSAKFYFLLGKKDVLIPGPFLNMPQHVQAFKKRWGKTTVKGKRVFALKKSSAISWKNALKTDQKLMKEMSIKSYRILGSK